MSTLIYARKPICPRDLGFFHCDECAAKLLELSGLSDHPLDWDDIGGGCGRVVDGKVCGKTHLGYEWCEDCRAKGRTEHGHFGEFVVVAKVG